ncbi:MAG TPA: benzoyl-CoA reductase subunit A [bacterium]|nr:benzoyl-CoA reductase subunit A [bacterium]
MRHAVGVDLGSTTTKAVLLDEDGRILGRGITNSRSNYDVACQVAMTEAMIGARFGFIASSLEDRGLSEDARRELLGDLERAFLRQQYLAQLENLRKEVEAVAASSGASDEERRGSGAITERMEQESAELFSRGAERKSDFFRDLAGSRYAELAEETAQENGAPFDRLVGLFDKAILAVENTPLPPESFEEHVREALRSLPDASRALEDAVGKAVAVELEQLASVGTGYGRARLPFPKESIRSEILCHGLGAHAMFPGTRTVLDIGGQDTKAIQVDERGIVTSFQMNDRCAAGCGRYLGYIADEMNLGVHQLGPLAVRARRPVRINSTCTVFAGAELRERLSLGEKREDILGGLHRAIILRAMSLLARSGGVTDQFTFTGGVAKNPAAVGALKLLVKQNYGEVALNISPDSIYTGAMGAALFALRDAERRKAA